MDRHAETERIESRALRIGAVANIIMAVAAWYTYSVSNSEAILLDGNYSFVVFIGILVALKISAIKARQTQTFPLGQFFYEALYGLIKGLMLLGTIIMAVTTSVVRIVLFTLDAGDDIPLLNPDPIFFYAIAMAVLCYAISALYYTQNRRIGMRSIILVADQKSTFVDGTLSLGIAGGVLFLTQGGGGSGAASWAPYIADSVITLILSYTLIDEPLSIIRSSIVELAGGTLQDKPAREKIESTVERCVADHFGIRYLHTSKTGSRYMVLAYLEPKLANEQIDIGLVGGIRERIRDELEPEFPYLHLELIPA